MSDGCRREPEDIVRVSPLPCPPVCRMARPLLDGPASRLHIADECLEFVGIGSLSVTCPSSRIIVAPSTCPVRTAGRDSHGIDDDGCSGRFEQGDQSPPRYRQIEQADLDGSDGHGVQETADLLGDDVRSQGYHVHPRDAGR